MAKYNFPNVDLSLGANNHFVRDLQRALNIAETGVAWISFTFAAADARSECTSIGTRPGVVSMTQTKLGVHGLTEHAQPISAMDEVPTGRTLPPITALHLLSRQS